MFCLTEKWKLDLKKHQPKQTNKVPEKSSKKPNLPSNWIMLDAPIPLSSRYSYHTIFSDICKTRFNHLVTRMCSTFTVLQAILLTILCGGSNSFLENALLVPLRFFVLYLVSLLVIVTRKNYLHVQYSGYSNMWKLVFGQLICLRFFVYELVHLSSSFLISLSYSVLLGSEGAGQSAVFKQCYMLYVWVLIPTVYTLQHCLFDLDRLSFSFDTHFQPPQQYISASLGRIIVKCTIMTLLLTFASPFVFSFAVSRWWIGASGNLQLLLLSFVVFINLEFINVAFSANMSIGCLHKGKPISSLSSTPIETLVTGLSSHKPFTKLTAFQELSYRATASDSSLRLPVYHTRYRNTHIWPVILRECLITIQATNESVTSYLKSMEHNLKFQDNSNRRTRKLYDNDKDKLFGNQVADEPAGFSSSQVRFPGSPPVTSSDGHSRRITLKDDNVLLRRKFQRNDKKHFPFGFKSSLGADHAYDEPIITHETTLLKVIGAFLHTIRNFINSFFFPSAVSSQEDQPQVSIIEAWCISKRRQAERLVPQPVCHAECIISLMGLLINAIEEDPKGGVVSSVGEVLKCLERSVGSLGRFADWSPENKDKTDDENDEPDVISILYDLSVSAFLEIVLKYNVLLDELYLDEDVVKLSKWVLDMCRN